MTPEERRRLRREKVLQRSHISEKELSNSLMNKQTSELLTKAKNIQLTKEEEISLKNNTEVGKSKNQNIEKQIRAKKLNKFKGLILIICGIISAVYNTLIGKNQHQNLFIMFLLLDIIFIFSFTGLKVKVDKEKYDQRLTGFINIVQKIGFFFDLVDDLSCFFIPFILSSCLISYFKFNQLF